MICDCWCGSTSLTPHPPPLPDRPVLTVEDGTQGLHFCSLEEFRDAPLDEESRATAQALRDQSMAMLRWVICVRKKTIAVAADGRAFGPARLFARVLILRWNSLFLSLVRSMIDYPLSCVIWLRSHVNCIGCLVVWVKAISNRREHPPANSNLTGALLAHMDPF